MRKETVSHLTKKSSKNSTPSSLRNRLTIAFLLLSVPIYHQEVVLLYDMVHKKDDSVLCEHTVRYELQKHGVQHIDIVVAQSLLETGSYRSQLVRTHNNLFGFRTKNGYLKFKSWKESCKYYADWQRRKYKGGEYFTFLKAIGYAEDPDYVSKLKTILRRIDV